jgi:cell division septation protein DedD
MASVSRICGQFWESSKGAVGKVSEGITTWKEHADPGQAKRLVIGVTGALLALTLLVWGGRTLLRKTETPSSPALITTAPSTPTPPAALEAKPPQTGVPPVTAMSEPAPGSQTPAVATPSAPPAVSREVKPPAPAAKDRYQLWVAAYRTLDEAEILKKKIQAKNVPVTIYRGAVDKKLIFAVKAGPFTGKKTAEDMASRLKNDIHLAQAPKLIKLEGETCNPKTASGAKGNGKSKTAGNTKTTAKTNAKTTAKTTTPKAPR